MARDADGARGARLKAALKANMGRRKAQRRSRDAGVEHIEADPRDGQVNDLRGGRVTDPRERRAGPRGGREADGGEGGMDGPTDG